MYSLIVMQSEISQSPRSLLKRLLPALSGFMRSTSSLPCSFYSFRKLIPAPDLASSKWNTLLGMSASGGGMMNVCSLGSNSSVRLMSPKLWLSVRPP